MNKKLDEGFKMTDQSCDKCQKSLLISKDFKQLYCCYCDKYEAVESQSYEKKMEEEDEDDLDAEYEKILVEEQKYVKKEESPKKIISETNDDFDYAKYAKLKDSDDSKTNEALGEFLLQGYTMLATSCEKCLHPLMTSPSGVTKCYICEQNQKKKKTKIGQLTQGQSKLKVSQQESQLIEKSRQKTNDVSKQLGELLLQGWIMMQECCCDCYTPLMCKKSGEIYCVNCKKYYTQGKKIEEEQQSKANPCQNQKSCGGTSIQCEAKPCTYTKSCGGTNRQKRLQTQFKQNQNENEQINKKVKKESLSKQLEQSLTIDNEFQQKAQNSLDQVLDFYNEKLTTYMNGNNIDGVNKIITYIDKLLKAQLKLKRL